MEHIIYVSAIVITMSIVEVIAVTVIPFLLPIVETITALLSQVQMQPEAYQSIVWFVLSQ